MSLPVPWNELTPAEQGALSQDLTFTPRDDFAPRRYFRPSYKRSSPTPVSFYLYQDGIVYLPFRYALNRGRLPPLTHPSRYLLFTGELRDYQYGVCARIYDLLRTHRTAIIGLYPGFGKTVVGAYLTCCLALPTLVVIHLDVLIDQHVNTFLKYTSATIMVVGKIKSSLRSLMKEYPRRFIPCSDFATGATATRHPDVIIAMEQRVKDIPAFLIQEVGCLIVDEAHCFCVESRVYPLLACHPQYVIIQTATLERDDEMHEMLEPLVGTEGVFLEDNKHVQCLVIETGFRPPVDPEKEVNYHELMAATYGNPERVVMIGYFLQANPGFRILILTKLIDRCEYLARIIGTITSEVDYVHGNKPTFVPRDILVGTIQKVGTAFDPLAGISDPSIKQYQVVLLDLSIKSYPLLVQATGRAMRSSHPVIVQLLDNHRTYDRHFQKNLRYYRRKGYDVHYINRRGGSGYELSQYGITPD